MSLAFESRNLEMTAPVHRACAQGCQALQIEAEERALNNVLRGFSK